MMELTEHEGSPTLAVAASFMAGRKANRIINLTCDSKPVELVAEFIIATNCYRASLDGSFLGATKEADNRV